jgi:bla regulator protein blaR1
MTLHESIAGIDGSFITAAGNHLWQSSLVVILAALLALVLRGNQARARYWIWLMASMKFVVPFSLLVEVGSHFAKPQSVTTLQSPIYRSIDSVSMPFTESTMSTVLPSVATESLHGAALFSEAVAAAWLCGFVIVLAVWLLRWIRVARIVREATELHEGREVDALRHAESAAGMHADLSIRLSQAGLEPGVFGLFRPVLLWPAGISEHLEEAHLESIFAHELRHVRRRDNLTAAIHMAVQAIFWFHPLVWWLGVRLTEERERACDEEVLLAGSEPGVYAESILKTCAFCVESPLACVSGITGADLKSRIVRIMTQSLGDKLGLGKKLLLVVMAIAVAAGPFVFGLVNISRLHAQLLHASPTPTPTFEVATVKPTKPGATHNELMMGRGTFTFKNNSLKDLIKFAYNCNNDDQILGEPSWVDTEKFDIDAKEAESLAEKLDKLPRGEERINQVRYMVQTLLAERFNLKVHMQTKELPVYALVVAKGGTKLTKTAIDPTTSHGRGIRSTGRGEWKGFDAPMEVLVHALSSQPELGGRVVLDQTGLKDSYDWNLHWTPETSGPGGAGSSNALDSSAPELFTALQEQLGLKLEPTKGMIEVIVVDHVDHPSEN